MKLWKAVIAVIANFPQSVPLKVKNRSVFSEDMEKKVW